MNTGKRTLVVKLADIGDAVLALPAVQALRRDDPEGQLNVLTSPAGAQVFRLSPAVDEVFTFDRGGFSGAGIRESLSAARWAAKLILRIRRAGYDRTVLLHHLTTVSGARKQRLLAAAAGSPIVAGLDNGRGGFLSHRALDFGFGEMPEWEYGLEIIRSLGIDAHPESPEIRIPEDDRRSMTRKLTRTNDVRPYAVIHVEVGAFSPARAWPVERWISVARSIATELDLKVVFVGVNSEPEIARVAAASDDYVDLTGATGFGELCALIDSAELVLGGDSAISHLAGAFDRPAISIFGPTNIDAWKPIGSSVQNLSDAVPATGRSTALHLGLPCSPCVYSGYRLGRPDGCATRTCMTGISPDMVMNVVRRQLNH